MSELPVPSEARIQAGDWFMACFRRVAHRAAEGNPDGGMVRPLCDPATRDAIRRPATPEDRRCKRCEERSRA